MLTWKLITYFLGYLVIQVRGVALEKFINLCLTNNIYLWDIQRSEQAMRAKIRLRDFPRIRSIVRKTRCRAEIVRRVGLPFFLARACKRKMLFVGAVLFCIILYILSSYVWFVKTVGLTALPEEVVLAAAARAGLKPWVLKSDVDIKRVEHYLLLELPELAWAGVTFKGTMATVEVAEKTMMRTEDKSPAHIVAAKDGLITEIIALVGEPAVKKGDMVKKGQVLISGEVVPRAKDQAGNLVVDPATPRQYVRAHGIVKARVWYQGYGESPLQVTVTKHTGRTATAVVLKFGVVEKILFGGGKIPFAAYDIKISRKGLALWRNNPLPVESTIITYYELVDETRTLTVEEAKEEAKRKALEKLQEQIGDNTVVLHRNIEVLSLPETDLVRVKVTLETLEDIGIIEKIHH